MAMFDNYRPDPPLACPRCGKPLEGWQGKEGPCALLVWKQGNAEPVAQLVDDDARGDWTRLRQERLPESFTIYAWDAEGHQVEAKGHAPEGVWTTTTLTVG